MAERTHSIVRTFLETAIGLGSLGAGLAALPQLEWPIGLRLLFDAVRSFPLLILFGLGLNFVLSFVILRQGRPWFSLLLLAVTLFGTYSYGSDWRYLFQHRETILSVDAPNPIRVLVANAEFGQANAAELRRIFDQNNINLAFISEATMRFLDALDLRNKLVNKVELPGVSAEGCALYSQYPLENIRVFVTPPTWFYGVSAELVLSDKDRIRIIAVHAPAPMGDLLLSRRAEFFGLLNDEVARKSPGPTVILGDLNAAPTSSAYKGLLQRHSLRSAAAGFGYLPSWYMKPIPILKSFIDHIIIGSGLTAHDYRVLGDFGSDHFAVGAEIMRNGDGVDRSVD